MVCAYNNTFFVAAIDSSSKRMLLHLAADGSILFKKSNPFKWAFFYMMNPFDLLHVDYTYYIIEIIDLQTYKTQ